MKVNSATHAASAGKRVCLYRGAIRPYRGVIPPPEAAAKQCAGGA
jgi:hypothetical protein